LLKRAKILDFCVVLQRTLAVLVLCLVSVFSASVAYGTDEITITYQCASYGGIQQINNTPVTVSLYSSYSIDLGTVANNYCYSSNSWDPKLMRCYKQSDNSSFIVENVYGGVPINTNEAANYVCTIYYQPKDISFSINEIYSCTGSLLCTIYFLGNDITGNSAYLSYDNSTGPSNLVQTDVDIANACGFNENYITSCYAGLSFEACEGTGICNNGGTTLGHAATNSYNEWLNNLQYEHGRQYFPSYLDYHHAIRLNAPDADVGDHGTGFVWYCSPTDVLDNTQYSLGYSSCYSDQYSTNGCYGHDAGLYPFVPNLSCCSIGCYYNNPGYHLGYQVDFTQPLITLASNQATSYSVEVPHRSGYIFLGYYDTPDGVSGTQYVDANGYLTPAGLAAAGGMVGSNTTACGQWEAHWCQIGQTTNSDGTCDGNGSGGGTGGGGSGGGTGGGGSGGGTGGGSGGTDCVEGYSLQDMNYVVDNSNGTAYTGKELDGNGFSNGDDSVLVSIFSGNGGDFAVMFNNPKTIFGSAMCIKQDGDPTLLGDMGSSGYWLQSSQNMDFNHDKNCWCNLNGYSTDGVNVVNINNDNWVLIQIFNDEQECEANCTQECAKALMDGAEHVQDILATAQDCFQDEYTVSYWCSVERYEEHDSSNIITTDSVSSGQSYSPFGAQQILEESDCYDPAAYTVSGYACFKYPSLTPVDINDMDPWNIDENVDCYPELTPNVFTITLNKTGGVGGTDVVYSKYSDGVYLNNNNGALTGKMLTSNNNAIVQPTRSGYTFLGYYSSTANDAQQYIYSNGKITQNGNLAGKGYTSNATWYAKWQQDTVNYTVTYNCGTATGQNATVNVAAGTYTVRGEISSNTNNNCSTPSGYEFAGWACGDTSSTFASANVYGTNVNIPSTFGGTNSGFSVLSGDNSTVSLGANMTCVALWSATNPCSPGTTVNYVLGKENFTVDWTENAGSSLSFSYGSVTVEQECTSNMGVAGMPGNPGSGTGNYCWCRVSGFVPSSGTTPTLVNMPWIYMGTNAEVDQMVGCTEWVGQIPRARKATYQSHSCRYSIGYDCGSHGTLISPYDAVTHNPMSVTSGYSYTIADPNNVCSADTGYSLLGSGTNTILGGWECLDDESSTIYLNSNVYDSSNNATNTWGSTGVYQHNYTCTAKWNQNTYTITYLPGIVGNSAQNMPNNTSVTSGSNFYLGSAPNLNGWTFIGWKCPHLSGATGNNGYFFAGSFGKYTYDDNEECTAQWERNKVYLSWNRNGGSTSVTPVDSCQYGIANAMAPIAQPNKDGYAFDGWLVSAWENLCDLSYINFSEAGTDNKICVQNNGQVLYGNVSDFGINATVPGQWGVGFTNYGPAVGMSLCSSTVGSNSTSGTPSINVNGKYCWCKVTTYINAKHQSCLMPANGLWGFAQAFNDAGVCYNECPNVCMERFRGNDSAGTEFRHILYGLQ
jgi:hypothetical protein